MPIVREKRKVRVINKQIKHRLNGIETGFDTVEAEDMIDYASELPEYRRKLIEAHAQAIRKYVPHTYPGNVVLVRCGKSTKNSLSVWETSISGKITEYNIAGAGHHDLFQKPHIDYWASALRDCLEETDRKRLAEEFIQTANGSCLITSASYSPSPCENL